VEGGLPLRKEKTSNKTTQNKGEGGEDAGRARGSRHPKKKGAGQPKKHREDREEKKKGTQRPGAVFQKGMRQSEGTWDKGGSL